MRGRSVDPMNDIVLNLWRAAVIVVGFYGAAHRGQLYELRTSPNDTYPPEA